MQYLDESVQYSWYCHGTSGKSGEMDCSGNSLVRWGIFVSWLAAFVDLFDWVDDELDDRSSEGRVLLVEDKPDKRIAAELPLWNHSHTLRLDLAVSSSEYKGGT